MANAQIRIAFGNGQQQNDGSVQVEIDSRPDGLNQGVSSWVPGDTAYFLVYATPNARVLSVSSSFGEVTMVGPVEVQHEEELVFEHSDSAQLSHPCTAITQIAWSGEGLGNVAVAANGTGIKADRSGTVAVRVWYNAVPVVYRLETNAAECLAQSATAIVSVEWEAVSVDAVVSS
ncbi:MAG: hypothetical protein HQM04_16700 [Magnetococcales bacterium]|nr:hypothetical protein [Magnetococcales bacterium]MBF0116670.1 hypothetical protein [Magnetococcales bacterium]